ncbi:hypothetical protein M514_21160 [Trichuris suis]|uniref:Uncharacterized protein n=1 Tax=Trichuris suis TaxID=68888 RepID=A0A085NAZ7_9BILA|nr:hypothetical protein M514_21160 [Trichuris suis]
MHINKDAGNFMRSMKQSWQAMKKSIINEWTCKCCCSSIIPFDVQLHYAKQPTFLFNSKPHIAKSFSGIDKRAENNDDLAGSIE